MNKRATLLLAALTAPWLLADCSSSSGGGAPDADAGTADAGPILSQDAGGDTGADAAQPPPPCTADQASRLATDPKNCGTCGKDCGGGGCSAGKCQPFMLVSTVMPSPLGVPPNTPAGLCVSGNTVYFTTTNGQASELRSVATTGGTVTKLETEAANINSAAQIVTDGTTLFFGASFGLYARPIAAGPPVLFASRNGANVVGVALAGGKLYLGNLPIGVGASVVDATAPGGTVTDVPGTAAGSATARGLAVGNGFLYYADGGDAEIRVVNLADGTYTLINGTPFVNGIAVDGTELWYTQRSGPGASGVFHRPADGTGSVTTVVSDEDDSAIAVTAEAIYWADAGGNRLMKLVR